MKGRFVARSLSLSPLMINVRAGTLPLKAFVVSYVSFVLLYHLIHLMWGQLAMSGYLRVQNVSDLLSDSIQGDFIFERLQFSLCELVFPILAQITDGSTYSNHEICGILAGSLTSSQPCSSAPGRCKSHSSAPGASAGAWTDPECLQE